MATSGPPIQKRTADTIPDQYQASDNRAAPATNSPGVTPARETMAMAAKAKNGKLILIPTRWHRWRGRRWPDTAARRRGAEKGATGNTATALQRRSARMSARRRYTKALRTHRDDPEPTRSPEVGWRRRIAAAGVERGRLGSGEMKLN